MLTAVYKYHHNRKGLLAPDIEMWRALEEGRLLRDILSDFYRQVYADSRLSPFFDGISIERAIDKQYSFLHSIFTGEKCYFGDHPKNAHHWMVISDELFDYREALMESSLRKYGLAEYLIQRWRNIDEVFRKSIVKDKPRPRKIDGLALPLEGYSPLIMDVSGLCDCCGAELACGTLGYYHRRTGKLNCRDCHNQIDNPGQTPENSALNLESDME
jgi:truncated hemoglobin YjbI